VCVCVCVCVCVYVRVCEDCKFQGATTSKVENELTPF